MRKPGEFHRLRLAVGAARKRDAENLACGDGVFTKCLVKVAYPEKEDCIGVFLFHLQILEHKRGFCYLCHIGRLSVMGIQAVLFREVLIKYRKEPRGHAHINYKAHHVVGNLYEGAGGEGRVDFYSLKRKRHKGTENGGENNHRE